jgi:hypothetical protein
MANPPPKTMAHFLLSRGREAAAIPITIALSPLKAKSIIVMVRKRSIKSHVQWNSNTPNI